MRDMPNRTRGTTYVLLCVASWALIPVVAKLGQTKLDNHQFLFWSSLVSFAVLLGATIAANKVGRLVEWSSKDWAWIGFLGFLGTYVYYLLIYLGYSTATGLEVLVTQYTWPIFVVILSAVILGERLSFRKLVSLGLGFTGVFLVLTKGEVQKVDVSNASVIALVAVGAFCFALFSTLSKRVEREPLGVVTAYFLVATTASFISMMTLSDFALPSRGEVGPVLLNGVIVNGFSYVLWIWALRATEASYLAPFTFITPVLSAVYLIAFFDEPFLAVYLVGLGLVVVGGLVNSLGGLAQCRT